MAPRIDTDEMRPAPPQTEDSRERGFVTELPQDLGRSDSLDDDDIGDIADEGHGHRG
jgi:hypothetical protein